MEYIEANAAVRKIEPFELWEENRAVFEIFLSCSTQMRVAGMGAVLGFDYLAVELDCRLSGREITKEIWSDFKVIENEVRKIFSEKSSK